HRAFDLLRRGLVGRQHLVQLVIGDVAPRLGARDHLAHADIGHIQERTVGVAGGLVLAGLGALGGRQLGARLDRKDGLLQRLGGLLGFERRGVLGVDLHGGGFLYRLRRRRLGGGLGGRLRRGVGLCRRPLCWT